MTDRNRRALKQSRAEALHQEQRIWGLELPDYKR